MSRSVFAGVAYLHRRDSCQSSGNHAGNFSCHVTRCNAAPSSDQRAVGLQAWASLAPSAYRLLARLLPVRGRVCSEKWRDSQTLPSAAFLTPSAAALR
jgi:hypothetical protein